MANLQAKVKTLSGKKRTMPFFLSLLNKHSKVE